MKILKYAALMLAFASASDVAARVVINLDRDWQFAREGSTDTMTVHLPHDFQIGQPWVAPDSTERADNTDTAANVRSRLSARGFKEMGRASYRKMLTPPDSLKGKRLLLDFGGIMLVGDVYLNGERIGGTDYGYLGFECDVTKKLSFGQENEIVVTADTGEPNNSRWYTGGGLYRSVNLIATDPALRFNRHGLQIETPEITSESATLRITCDLYSAKPHKTFIADITIYAPDGSVAASRADTVAINSRWRNREYTLADLPLPSPMLWDCENPNLYRAEVTLKDADGIVRDRLSTNFGVRTLEFSPEFGFKLNGRKVLFKGIANHHTLGALGAAAYPRALEKRIELLKQFGFNTIRTSHNPYSEEFLDLCDRHGMLVLDEIYDKWLKQYAGGREEWSTLWQHDIPEWVRRDRNHPSVVIWSLGNELQGYSNLPFNDWGVTAYNLLKTLLKRYDNNRPLTVAMHPRYRSLETDSLPAPLVHETDIASYNYRYMYFPGDSRRFPDMKFLQSEASLAAMGPNFFEPDNDKGLGLYYWGMIDYLGESRGWPAKGWTDGVFDISLNPKPNAWFVKSMFSDAPTVHIGVIIPKESIEWNDAIMAGESVVDSWNFSRGDTLSLYTYTNADEVELRLNGRSLGRRPNSSDPKLRNRIRWDNIPYSAGNIEAIAYTDGRETARHRIETAGRPVRLIAEPDNSSWSADGTDLQHISITAVDKHGRRVPFANEQLKFSLVGNAEIVGVSNGDMTSDELHAPASPSSASRSLHQGRALVILRSTPTAGASALTVAAPSLPPLTIKLNTISY